MSLLRFAGRVLFSTPFIVDGYRAVTKPDTHLEEAQAVVDKVVPKAKSVLPHQLAGRLPEDVRAWGRILGITKLVGGVAFATGLLRRPGAALLAAATVPSVVAVLPGRGSSSAAPADKAKLVNQLALLGGALLASQDTQGKPNLRYRARYGREQLGAAADRGRAAMVKSAETTKKLTAARAKVAKASVQHSADQANLAAKKRLRHGHRKAKDTLSKA